jgi:hypothetical protein
MAKPPAMPYTERCGAPRSNGGEETSERRVFPPLSFHTSLLRQLQHLQVDVRVAGARMSIIAMESRHA